MKKIRVKKDAFVFNEENKSEVRVSFKPKQTKKFRKKLGMTVHEVDLVIDGNRITIPRMYRNGKRIHRKSPFKAKMVK
jgi:maltodextrin utilization protein YvdJ